MIKAAFHRHVWQRLPQRLRREMLFRATALAAPRPSLVSPKPSLPIYVVGTFGAASGLGQSARFCRDALLEVGLPVEAVDITKEMMQPVDHADAQNSSNRIRPGAGTIILHVNAPLVPLAMLKLGRNAVAGKYVVGSWAWELPQTPADWRFGIPFVHEIWMPATFGAAAVRAIAEGRPVRVVPYAIATGCEETLNAHATSRSFTVLTMFSMASSFARKNPLASIAAFREAFGDDPSARLIIKTSRLDAYPQGMTLLRTAIGDAENIEIDDRVLPSAEIEQLYDRADVVISLHRSEGFGLLVAEAMIRGIPAIATDWSATTDFVDETCGVPIPYRLVPPHDPQGTYDHASTMWAEPDASQAAIALRRLRDDPGWRARLGTAGAARARELWSASAYGRAVQGYLGLSSSQ